MTAPYECEVRARLLDASAFHGQLAHLGGRVRERYAFTDHYYRPATGPWDPRQRALRIREHQEPPAGCEVLLTQVAITQVDGLPFKRSSFAEGKVRLYAGAWPACLEVVRGLGFVPWLVVRKRDGTLFEIPGLGELVTEYVEGIGWMVEVEKEGADPEAAARAIGHTLATLGISADEVTAVPVAALVAAATPRGAKVYFCGSIRGGRDRQMLYSTIVDHLQDRGFEVLTTHVAAPDVLVRERQAGATAGDIYARDLRWLGDCDVVVAEVSTASLGVGVEITEAQHLGKPVVVLAHDDVQLSAMVSGNPYIRLITYADEADLFAQLDRALPTPGERDRGTHGS